MPMYSYQCKKCSEKFETIEKYADRKKPQECPVCGYKSGKYVEELGEVVYSLNRSFSRMRHGQ